MYGLVNKAIQDLVLSAADEDTWQKIKAKARMDDAEFVDATTYDDDVTYQLVAAASEVLNQPAEKILYDFGRHWILYTGREGWASVFSLGGDNLKSFLLDLDEMHARVQVAMPESRMPQFTVTENEYGLEVVYRSHRDGLAPMVEGLLGGLAEQFNEHWEVSHTGKRDLEGFDTFQLKHAQSSFGEGLDTNAA